jgi:hypothetical protein
LRREIDNSFNKNSLDPHYVGSAPHRRYNINFGVMEEYNDPSAKRAGKRLFGALPPLVRSSSVSSVNTIHHVNVQYVDTEYGIYANTLTYTSHPSDPVEQAPVQAESTTERSSWKLKLSIPSPTFKQDPAKKKRYTELIDATPSPNPGAKGFFQSLTFNRRP